MISAFPKYRRSQRQLALSLASYIRRDGMKTCGRWTLLGCAVLMVTIIQNFLATSLLFAEVPPVYSSRPTFYDFLPNALGDVPDFLHNADIRDNAENYLKVGILSGVLIYYDEDILIGSQKVARQWHLISKQESGTGSRLVARTQVSGIDVDLRLPRGTNSCFYFIGDGLTTLAIIAGLNIYGFGTEDNRALNTASQIAESTVLTGVFVITSKYSFGRQSPNQRTEDGGAWHPMPNPIQYLKHVSSYDAFPSGHVATATSTLMVLAANYVEKPWIMQVGYGAIGLLMFGMLNNGVHWAGDYPLAIAIGYNAAQTVVQKRKPKAVAMGVGLEIAPMIGASRPMQMLNPLALPWICDFFRDFSLAWQRR